MLRTSGSSRTLVYTEAGGGSTGTPLIRHDIFALMAGSAIWMLWSVLVVIIFDTGYPFSISELFSLIATAGLSGASVRLGSGFLIKNTPVVVVWFISLLLLILPLSLLISAFFTQSPSFWHFQLAAISSGIGAVFLPLRACMTDFGQSTARIEQEARSALADSGLIVAQVVLPVLGFMPLAGWLTTLPLEYNSSHVLGRISAGSGFSIFSALSVFFLLLLVAISRALPAFLAERRRVLPALRTLLIYTVLTGISFLLVYGVGAAHSLGDIILAGLLIIVITIFLLLMVFSRIPRGRESGFLPMMANRKLQLLSLLHLMGAGSMLGFSASLPLLGKEFFDLQWVGGDIYLSNPLGTGILTYVWLLPVIAVITRGISAWLARYYKPEWINQSALLLMLVSVIVLAASFEYLSENRNYIAFFFLVLVFFIGSGLSAGSVFYQISKAFPAASMPQVMTWIGGISSFGVFYIANMFSSHHNALNPGLILYSFSLFYGVGMLLNWFFFLRRRSELSF
ncbi:hypothetical protein ACQUQU_18065 [Thalassolituus sp. LLYu03]|uniref:hypothetical protein n=1 Tax=Thalassolituus sp. LLYu03 TaxID=3421656 RepID=UPI003D2CB6BA